jgi:hypothetical protein
MEAATALTQLVGASAPPCNSSSTSAVSIADGEKTLIKHNISDDDSTMASSHISLLRENHLKALRAASLAPIDDDMSANAGVKVASAAQAPATSKDKEIFPVRLHALLADSSVRDIVAWLPHGNSFVILRPDAFATQVLPRYFATEGSSKGGKLHKYPSFTRKLNRWGFRQISRGPDAGAFYHEMFRRDEADACRRMMCQKSRKTLRDDCKSVSSASTVSVTSGKLISSAAITVSTSGSGARSLPPKKRRGIVSATEKNNPTGIPTNLDLKPNNSSLLTEKVSTSSDVETMSELSADGSAKAIDKSALRPQAALDHSSAAKEALARHFYEQHRAIALAALKENSRKAMLAMGIDVESQTNATSSSSNTERRHESLGATTNSQVFAPTVVLKQAYSTQMMAQQQSAAAEAAKSALFEAFKKALSGPP